MAPNHQQLRCGSSEISRDLWRFLCSMARACWPSASGSAPPSSAGRRLILIVFTIVKTFIYDTRNLSQGYHGLSFLGLGALLMAVSFAYQKDWLALREPGTAQSAQDKRPEQRSSRNEGAGH